MGVLSKLFEAAVENRQCCNDLCHTKVCASSAITNFYKFFLSNAKFFAPVVAVPLLMKIKKLDRQLLYSNAHYYKELLIIGTSVGWSIMIMICLFRQCLGKFYYHTAFAMPTIVGSIIGTYFGSPRALRLIKDSIFQGTLESLLLKRKNVITRSVSDSVWLQTCIFMCSSALILHAKRHSIYNGFWLLKPNALDKQVVNEEALPHSACIHKEKSCTLHLVNGVRTYLLIGLSLDAVKMLFSQIPAKTNGIVAIVQAKLSNFQISSTALLASYVGIYRYAFCFLNRKIPANTNQDINHLIAGFLSGVSYLFYAKSTLLCFGFMLTTQILWKHVQLEMRKYSTNKRLAALIKQLPVSRILHSVALAYLVHTYIVRPHYISSFGVSMINGVTDNYALHIMEKVQRAFAELKL